MTAKNPFIMSRRNWQAINRLFNLPVRLLCSFQTEEDINISKKRIFQ